MTNRRCRTLVAPAVIAGLIACAPLAAWIARMVSTSKVDTIDADYMYRPLGWSPTARTVVGITSLAVVVAAATVALRCPSSSRWVRPGVFVPLASASAFVGLTYHIVTAPVIGANIGGGLMVMIGAPFVGAMVIVAVAQARTTR
ncbi:MAG TPA: hypothetical protein PK020_05515 [Ilumatobacteraceae bacterium]|nr:hypothetical protein [Ilumatobacteraceae bacterium]